jgi:hypothetical protein
MLRRFIGLVRLFTQMGHKQGRGMKPSDVIFQGLQPKAVEARKPSQVLLERLSEQVSEKEPVRELERVRSRDLANPKVRAEEVYQDKKSSRYLRQYLMRKYQDGPQEDPHRQGLLAYGSTTEDSNPYSEEQAFDRWLAWFAGWHQARRDAGVLSEDDSV